MGKLKFKKLILDKCEIDGCDVDVCLHKHHVVEQTNKNTTNHPMNLCILCPNHHYMLHSGLLKIIGIFPSTKQPNNRTIVYELNGVKNIEGIEDSYFTFKNKSYKI